jgi:3-methyladenine DNA glycosylase AlkC
MGVLMPEKLKDLFFTESSIGQFGETIKQAYPAFDQKKFTALVFDADWDNKELKQKMRHVTRCLHETLPTEYPEALAILLEVAPSAKSFEAMVLPDYVECYGLDDWDRSLPALAFFTRFASSEFAIRPFIAQDAERAMEYLYVWAEDDNHHVRRLASEGCRPQLPWAMALPIFKEDPTLILPVLEKLKADESEYVRKSVANNLNGISKDHPDLVLDICERWYGQDSGTDWIVKHACRTMLKAGNRRAMLLFGFADPTNVCVEDLTLETERPAIGDELPFTFDLKVDTAEPCKVRLEYAVQYVRAKGKVSRKVFQIREDTFEPGSHAISRKLFLVDQSTRKHHPGEHEISIFVNGVEKAKATFQLTDRKRRR